MAGVLVDADLPNTPEAIQLEQITGVENAWCFVVRLWMWGIQNNIVDGKLRFSRTRVAALTGRSARSGHLVDGLVSCGFLEPGEDARGAYFYMKGWHRNATYFKEKEKDRERKKNKRLLEMSGRNSTQTSNGDPSPSPSLPLSQEEKELDPKHSDRELPQQPSKQPIRDPMAAKFFIENFNTLARAQGTSPAIYSGLDKWRAGELVERCRAAKLKDIDLLVPWFQNKKLPSHVLEELHKAAPKLIESLYSKRPQPVENESKSA